MPLNQLTIFQFQPIYAYTAAGVVDENPPGTRIWYSMFNNSGGLEIIGIGFRQRNGVAAAKSVDVRFIIDGTIINTNFPAIVEATWGYYWLGLNGDVIYSSADPAFPMRSDVGETPLSCIKIEVLFSLAENESANQEFDIVVRFAKI